VERRTRRHHRKPARVGDSTEAAKFDDSLSVMNSTIPSAIPELKQGDLFSRTSAAENRSIIRIAQTFHALPYNSQRQFTKGSCSKGRAEADGSRSVPVGCNPGMCLSPRREDSSDADDWPFRGLSGRKFTFRRMALTNANASGQSEHARDYFTAASKLGAWQTTSAWRAYSAPHPWRLGSR
jgi:hypothetical protein